MIKRIIRQVSGWSCIYIGLLSIAYLVIAGWNWRVSYGVFLIPIGIWFLKPFLYTLRRRVNQ